MAINITDFDKIWASNSPLTPYSFTDANYQEGWNFISSTPPARQMWDGYMKWSDEKQQWIVNNFLPLSGGTMTGNIILADGGNPLSTAGGTLTGEVDGVTPASNDNSTKLATTEWVVGSLKENAFILDDSHTPTIPENSDLNDYTTAGTYRATSSTTSATLSNCPVSSSAFKLFVIEVGYGNFNYGMQIILGIARAMYVRNKTANGWTAWGKLNYTDV